MLDRFVVLACSDRRLRSGQGSAIEPTRAPAVVCATCTPRPAAPNVTWLTLRVRRRADVSWHAVKSLLVAIVLIHSTAAAAQTEDTTAPPSSLKQLSLEQLMDIEVTSVSRHPERLAATNLDPSYPEMDVRLGWRPVQGLELSIVGQNLLHGRHAEYGFPSPARPEIQRGVYGKVVWRF